ncbi:hypothetical protein ADL29_19220 [Streptomyces chattanoogensis]|uniref:Uncharacterized protein n=1 Tax=Streptomyces chattanoogensis TaxID=66876 RepID=A0A0N0XUV5_9ACTN|nr:hypothetical protein ADL29_19220 [Streptomyces chattanoogensis]
MFLAVAAVLVAVPGCVSVPGRHSAVTEPVSTGRTVVPGRLEGPVRRPPSHEDMVTVPRARVAKKRTRPDLVSTREHRVHRTSPTPAAPGWTPPPVRRETARRHPGVAAATPAAGRTLRPARRPAAVPRRHAAAPRPRATADGRVVCRMASGNVRAGFLQLCRQLFGR